MGVTWKGRKPAGAHRKDNRAPGTKTGSCGSIGTYIKQLPQNIHRKASKYFLSDILPADWWMGHQFDTITTKAKRIITFRKIIRKSHLTTILVTYWILHRQHLLTHPYMWIYRHSSKWQSISTMTLLIFINPMRQVLAMKQLQVFRATDWFRNL